MKHPIVIAVDGTSASGKSTTSKHLAKLLGYVYVDTGAMYRAVAWKAAHDGLDLDVGLLLDLDVLDDGFDDEVTVLQVGIVRGAAQVGEDAAEALDFAADMRAELCRRAAAQIVLQRDQLLAAGNRQREAKDGRGLRAVVH